MSSNDSLLPSPAIATRHALRGAPKTVFTADDMPLNHSIWLAAFTYLRSDDPTLTEESFLQFVASEAEPLKAEMLSVLLCRFRAWRDQHR